MLGVPVFGDDRPTRTSLLRFDIQGIGPGTRLHVWLKIGMGV